MKTLAFPAALLLVLTLTLLLVLTLTLPSCGNDQHGGSNLLPTPKHGGDAYSASDQPLNPAHLGTILFLPSMVFDLSRIELSSWDSSFQWWWPDPWGLHFQIPAYDNGSDGLYYGGEFLTIGLDLSRIITAYRYNSEFANRHHASLTMGWFWLELRLLPDWGERSWIWVSRLMWLDRFWPLILTEFSMTSMEYVASEKTLDVLPDGGYLASCGFAHEAGGLGYDSGGVTTAGSELWGLGQISLWLGLCCCGPKITIERRDGLGPFISEAVMRVTKNWGSCGAHFTFSIHIGQYLCSGKSPSPSLQGKGKI